MKEIRILLIEDSADGEILLRLKLEKSGFKPDITRLIDLEEIKNLAVKKSWDIIITDHKLPNFSSLDVIKTLEEVKVDIPIIIVPGRLDEFALAHQRQQNQTQCEPDGRIGRYKIQLPMHQPDFHRR